MNILVRSPNWIGDQVLAYPFFHFLREAYPSAKISVACAPWVEAVQFRNLVDEVVVMEKPLKRGFWSKLKAVEASAARMRGAYDLGISLPDSASSAWFLLRAGARERIGYGQDGRGILLTHTATKPLHVVHRADAYLALLPAGVPRPKRDATEFWGVPPPTDDELDPGVPGVVAGFEAERAWPGVEQLAPPQGGYWVVAPGLDRGFSALAG